MIDDECLASLRERVQETCKKYALCSDGCPLKVTTAIGEASYVIYYCNKVPEYTEGINIDPHGVQEVAKLLGVSYPLKTLSVTDDDIAAVFAE